MAPLSGQPADGQVGVPANDADRQPQSKDDTVCVVYGPDLRATPMELRRNACDTNDRCHPREEKSQITPFDLH